MTFSNVEDPNAAYRRATARIAADKQKAERMSRRPTLEDFAFLHADTTEADKLPNAIALDAAMQWVNDESGNEPATLLLIGAAYSGKTRTAGLVMQKHFKASASAKISAWAFTPASLHMELGRACNEPCEQFTEGCQDLEEASKGDEANKCKAGLDGNCLGRKLDELEYFMFDDIQLIGDRKGLGLLKRLVDEQEKFTTLTAQVPISLVKGSSSDKLNWLAKKMGGLYCQTEAEALAMRLYDPALTRIVDFNAV